MSEFFNRSIEGLNIDEVLRPIDIKAYRPEKDLPLVFTKDKYGNAGYDLYATERHRIYEGEIIKVPTNAQFCIPTGYYGAVMPRSGLSIYGINIIPGTVDSNYRGQIQAIVQNISDEAFTIERGMRVAQIIFIKHEIPNFIEVDTPEELGTSSRGDSGFGSSGTF